jgi:aminopeptidase N
MVENWSWIEEHFASDKSYNDFPQYAAQGLMTREQLVKYVDFFTPKRSIPALTRTIDLGIKEIEGRLDLLERDGDAIRKALQQL